MTQQKFVKLFCPARAVLFGAVLAASGAAFTARELFAQQPAVQAAQGTTANDAPKPEELPFVGFAALSPEEQERECEYQASDVLLHAAWKLNTAQKYDDGKALLKYLLGTDCSDSDYSQALGQYVYAANRAPSDDATKYAEIEQVLDEALAARPDSWRVKTRAADLLDSLPNVGYMQDGKFVYAREKRDDLLSCQARKRVRQLQLYAEALPLARKELERLDDPAERGPIGLVQSQASQYYLVFARYFQREGLSDYWRQLTLTDLSALPDYVPAADVAEENFSEIPVDEEGAPVFITASDSFETAQNDGERRQALLNELSERIPAFKTTVCLERAQEAETLFGVKNLHPFYLSFFSKDADGEQESRQEGFWDLSSLDDSETIAKLPSGVKRFKLPPEYDYINLQREMFESEGPARYLNEGIAKEYENRRQFDKAANHWRQLLEEKGVSERLKEEIKTALSEIVDPRVAIDSCSVVSGTKTNLNLRFRNAVGAEIVVKRLNLDEPLKMVRTEEFWQEYGEPLTAGGKLNKVVELILLKEYAPEETVTRAGIDAKIKLLCDRLDSFDLIGDEVARYSVELESSPKGYDKIARVDFPIREPGAYLIDITATGGYKDAAVVWLRDFVVARERLEKGDRYLALDAATGEPLAEQALEFFVFNRDAKDHSYVPAIKEYTKQTDEAGALFFPKAEYPNNYAAEVLITVPKDGVETASAAQTDFIGSQNIWRLHGSVSRQYRGALYLQNSQAFFLADRDVYRPNEKAEFKFIVGGSDYDTPEESMWAGQDVDFQIVDPNGEIVVTKSVTLDKHGAFCDSFEIPSDAKPGEYSVQLGLFKDQKDPYRRTSVYFTPGRGLLGIGSVQIAE